MMTLAKELGDELKTRIHVDAAAAKGIVERTGLDKVRHIDVGVLWLQEQAARKRLPLHKIDGTQNPADLMTKHLCSNKIGDHVRRLRLEFREGRAEAAAQLHSVNKCVPQEVIDEEEFIRGCEAIVVEYLKRQLKEGEEIGQAPGPGGAEVGQALGHGSAQDYDPWNQGGDAEESEVHEERGGDGGAVGKSKDSDRWICRGRNLAWIREHRTSRSELFCPSEAERGPSDLSRLWNIRKTAGVMEDGRKFEITDDWTKQNESKVSSLRQSWTGQTTFTTRTPQNKLERMQVSKEQR
jgi:hypothetical protein